MWIYLPAASPDCPSAPVSAALSSDCPLPSETLTAVSLSRNGERMEPPSLQRAWKKDSWLRRLSGMTSPPSQADCSVVAFLSSLPGFPASRIAPPASAKGPTTNAGSGPTLHAALATWDRSTSSWRTFDLFSALGLGTSSVTWPVSGSLRNGTCSARRRSGHPTLENGSSSLHTVREDGSGELWPTPTAQEATGPGEHGEGASNLRTQVARWTTPQAHDASQGTAAATDYASLTHPALAMPPPAASVWPTPRAVDAKDTKARGEGYGATLLDAAQDWPHEACSTPRARDWKAGGKDCLEPQATSFLPDQVSVSGGPTCSESGPTSSRRLNPRFVAALMAFPIGWSELTPLDQHSFTAWETASSALLRRLRSSVCSTGCTGDRP